MDIIPYRGPKHPFFDNLLICSNEFRERFVTEISKP